MNELSEVSRSVLSNLISRFPSWENVLNSVYTDELTNYLIEIKKKRNTGRIIYPSQQDAFNFLRTSFPVSACIIGQDPYPNGEATGVAFEVKDSFPITFSMLMLRKMLLKEGLIEYYDLSDGGGDMYNVTSTGLLCLNACNFIERKSKNTDEDYEKWANIFLLPFLKNLILNNQYAIPFVLFGKKAQELKPHIEQYMIEANNENPNISYFENNLPIKCVAHPASEGYKEGNFLNDDNRFGKFLNTNNQTETVINWEILPF